jgi:hypothetical protein
VTARRRTATTGGRGGAPVLRLTGALLVRPGDETDAEGGAAAARGEVSAV